MRRRLAVLAVGALLAAGAGCSDDDDGEGDEAAPSGRGTTSTSTTSIVFTGDPGSPFCTLLRDVEVQGLLDEEAASPADVEAAFTVVLGALTQVAEQAPPELAEDTALVLAGMVALDDALRAVGYRYDQLATEPEVAVEISRAANDPAFAVANARIEAYKDQVCGL